jgi:hypothetical protein
MKEEKTMSVNLSYRGILRCLLFLWLVASKVLAQPGSWCNVYVWDFTTETGEKNEVVKSLTNSFEQALTQEAGCFKTILNRRHRDEVLAHCQNEEDASNTNCKKALQEVGADLVIKGKVSSMLSNPVTVRITVEKINSGDMLAAAPTQSFQLNEITDVPKQESKMRELVKQLCSKKVNPPIELRQKNISPTEVSPVQVVEKYIRAINERNYDGAWQMFKSHSTNFECDYKGFLERVKSVKIEKIQLKEENDKTAIVRVQLLFVKENIRTQKERSKKLKELGCTPPAKFYEKSSHETQDFRLSFDEDNQTWIIESKDKVK